VNIYLDIETIPTQRADLRAEFAAAVKPPGNYKKPESIAEWMRDNAEAETEAMVAKTALDGTYGHIFCIGVAIDDAAPEVFCHATGAGDAPALERKTLTELHALLSDETFKRAGLPLFVGHNLVEFDLRFLLQRAIVCAVPFHTLPFNKRPWDEGVYDTMVKWAGPRGHISLDRLSKALGFPGKGEIDGSMVWPLVQEGRIQEVRDYCARDVELTRQVYKRMTFQA